MAACLRSLRIALAPPETSTSEKVFEVRASHILTHFEHARNKLLSPRALLVTDRMR